MKEIHFARSRRLGRRHTQTSKMGPWMLYSKYTLFCIIMHVLGEVSAASNESVTEAEEIAIHFVDNSTERNPNSAIYKIPKPNEHNHGASTHPCVRKCKEGSTMICKYTFQVEWYYAMSKACYNCPYNLTDCDRKDCVPADGFRRPIMTVNRQIPGPAIQVCEGDTIQVDVMNKISEETTTIHWHGLHQRGTPYMDGVPMVTQCPITPRNTFRYIFKADVSGTHFWHSHTGCQRADGLFGPVIVYKPESKDPHRKMYDYDLTEHIIQIIDWTHQLGVEKAAAHLHGNGTNKADTILLNGRGLFKNYVDPESNENISPLTSFAVEKGKRYRFRLINAGFLNCPMELSIDGHNLTIISSDGYEMKPMEVESLTSYAGERFDFIVHADKAVKKYWIRIRGLLDCGINFNAANQAAVLDYRGSKVEIPPGKIGYLEAERKGLQFNSLNVGQSTDLQIIMSDAEGLGGDVRALKQKPDRVFYVAYDFYKIDNPVIHKPGLYGYNEVPDPKERVQTPQLNHISMHFPPVPLLPYRDVIDTSKFCNMSTVGNCTDRYCECEHVLQAPLNSVIELILIDLGVAYDANHPFHLHGNKFQVVAMGKLGSSTTLEAVKELDKKGGIKRNLVNPPWKDTVTVPDGGFTILRIYADNPGYWLFHCHLELHVELGMALVIKVGEHSQYPKVPKGFPQCGNYLPTEIESPSKEIASTKRPGHRSRHWLWFSSSAAKYNSLAVFTLLPALLLLLCQ